MDQSEILILIRQLQDGSIDKAGYQAFKKMLSRRFKLSKRQRALTEKEDVILTALEMIQRCKGDIKPDRVNLFILCRLNDALYATGAAELNISKVPVSYRLGLKYDDSKDAADADKWGLVDCLLDLDNLFKY